MKIIYLHGFNSSSKSKKAQILKNSKAIKNLGFEIYLIDLPNSPYKAISKIEKVIKNDSKDTSLIGSSLGGFYASYLSDKYNLKSVTINPVISLHLEKMEGLIGPQVNYHSNEEYEFTNDMFNELLNLKVKILREPLNHFCLVKLNDQVLDHKKTIGYFDKAIMSIDREGSHEFSDFESKIPSILDFLR